MTGATHHTRLLHPTVIKATYTNQNGIVRSFVASKKNYLFFKRIFDILFSTLVIVLVLSWLLPIVGLLIRVGSKGPVFFRQKRTGLYGKPFYCLKLRTMISNDEADERQAEENDDEAKAGQAAAGDGAQFGLRESKVASPIIENSPANRKTDAGGDQRDETGQKQPALTGRRALRRALHGL